jgi:hypothetical protein
MYCLLRGRTRPTDALQALCKSVNVTEHGPCNDHCASLRGQTTVYMVPQSIWYHSRYGTTVDMAPQSIWHHSRYGTSSRLTFTESRTGTSSKSDVMIWYLDGYFVTADTYFVTSDTYFVTVDTYFVTADTYLSSQQRIHSMSPLDTSLLQSVKALRRDAYRRQGHFQQHSLPCMIQSVFTTVCVTCVITNWYTELKYNV